MNNDLKETDYCDFSNPNIRDLAVQLQHGISDPREITRRTFNHVRDGIPYGFDLFRRKASETLEKGYGVCWNKSLLLIALLRCNLIPARFGSIPVSRKFVKPTAGFVYVFTNSPYNHCIAQVCLDNKWITLDTVLDKQTFETCYLSQNVEWGIDWDGANDCQLYKEHVLGSAEIHKDIDKTINSKVGNKEWPAFFAVMLNAQLNKKLWQRTRVRVSL